MYKTEGRRSEFIIGSEVTVSELAKYGTAVLRHCEATGDPVSITNRNRISHILYPVYRQGPSPVATTGEHVPEPREEDNHAG